MTNAINPSHYKSDTIECIDAMKACSTPEEFRGHLKLTVLKYLWREDKKGEGDQARVENLEKAAWYLDRLVKDLRGYVVVPDLKDGLSAEALEKWEQYEGLLKNARVGLADRIADEQIPPHTINAADQGWIENSGVEPSHLPPVIEIEWASGIPAAYKVADTKLRWTLTGSCADIKRWRPSK